MASTVDWCEINYEKSPLIAEFWNTLSSIVLIIAGFIGYISHRNLKGSFVYIILTLVGFGSISFHSMLTASSQMLDEIPMIFLVVQLVINSVNMRKIWSYLLYISAILHSLLIFCTTGTPKFEFIVFQTSILISGICIFFSLYNFSKKNKDAMNLFKTGTSIFICGWIMWLIDFFFCSFLQKNFNPQFHAWWHILSAIGVYQLSILSLITCNDYIDNTCYIFICHTSIYRLYIFPRLVIIQRKYEKLV